MKKNTQYKKLESLLIDYSNGEKTTSETIDEIIGMKRKIIGSKIFDIHKSMKNAYIINNLNKVFRIATNIGLCILTYIVILVLIINWL